MVNIEDFPQEEFTNDLVADLWEQACNYLYDTKVVHRLPKWSYSVLGENNNYVMIEITDVKNPDVMYIADVNCSTFIDAYQRGVEDASDIDLYQVIDDTGLEICLIADSDMRTAVGDPDSIIYAEFKKANSYEEAIKKLEQKGFIRMYTEDLVI